MRGDAPDNPIQAIFGMGCPLAKLWIPAKFQPNWSIGSDLARGRNFPFPIDLAGHP